MNVSRRYYRHPDLDSPFWWAAVLIKGAVILLEVAVWFAWALIALVVAGIAKLTHHDDLASGALESTVWWGPQARGRRR
jgi:hypothetical protein